MKKISHAIRGVRHIEQLSYGHSTVHQLHPLFKLFFAFLFIVCVLTTSYYDFIELLFYFILILILCLLSHIEIKMILKRCLIGLPFSLCIGLSNFILMDQTVIISGMTIRIGLLSCLAILLKTTLCLAIVLELIATTPFDDIASELVHIKIPHIFVMVLVMTYRYIFLLVEEASSMMNAYHLRAPDTKGIQLKDMGSFVGNLLVRSFRRSNDVYDCMKCRGYHIDTTYVQTQTFEIENCFLMMMCIGFFMIIKVVL